MSIDDEILANPILREVKRLLENQTAKGVAKYGTTVNSADYSMAEWLNHLREELIDGAVYVTAAIQKLDESQLNFNKYQQLAARTAISHENELLNYGLGIAGEAGEVADLIKKGLFHGHGISKDEIAKELGDTLWYISQIARLFDLSLEDVAQLNIKKLQKRYPEGFSEEASINRND